MTYCAVCGTPTIKTKKFMDRAQSFDVVPEYATHFICSEDCECAMVAHYEKEEAAVDTWH